MATSRNCSPKDSISDTVLWGRDLVKGAQGEFVSWLEGGDRWRWLSIGLELEVEAGP